MKFTNKDLANAMGLKVGDRIKVKRENDKPINYELKPDYSLFDNIGYNHLLEIIIDEEYEIVKPKKKVGDTICREICCYNCPLKMLDCPDNNNRTLFEKLEMAHEEYNDKEIYDILKARLDKEVE